MKTYYCQLQGDRKEDSRARTYVADSDNQAIAIARILSHERTIMGVFNSSDQNVLSMSANEMTPTEYVFTMKFTCAGCKESEDRQGNVLCLIDGVGDRWPECPNCDGFMHVDCVS